MNSVKRIAILQLAVAAGRSHNARMEAWIVISLAFLSGTGVAVPKPSAPTSQSTVIVHRCTDPKGRVTFQDDACPKGSQDSPREMIRPKDPPPRPRARLPVAAPPLALLPEAPAPRQLIPPPAMYRCTSYDGDERFTEQYDPNPRCEPYVLYYPYPGLLTPAQALTCRWVEDSCVRLSDASACERWRRKRQEAVSAVMSSFSDTAAYRKSELERATQIVRESCS